MTTTISKFGLPVKCDNWTGARQMIPLLVAPLSASENNTFRLGEEDTWTFLLFYKRQAAFVIMTPTWPYTSH